MCGRFALYSSSKKLSDTFVIKQQRFDFEPSYNIAPTQTIMVICQLSDKERAVVSMRWGLIPFWQKEENISSGMINARIETINSKPAFRNSVKKRRCLIMADGFYEWKRTNSGLKQPYYIHLKNNQPFAIAGIWDRWIKEDKTIDSCCIITQDSNDVIGPIHERMPVIVDPTNYDNWLNVETQLWEELKELLTPFKSDEFDIYPVSRNVNSAKYNREDYIKNFSAAE